MEAWQLITIVIIALAFLIMLLVYKFFNVDAPYTWHNNYQESYQDAEKPFVALKNNCKHTGEKTLVTQYTVCGCEMVNLHCDTCGAIVMHGNVEC